MKHCPPVAAGSVDVSAVGYEQLHNLRVPTLGGLRGESRALVRRARPMRPAIPLARAITTHAEGASSPHALARTRRSLWRSDLLQLLARGERFRRAPPPLHNATDDVRSQLGPRRSDPQRKSRARSARPLANQSYTSGAPPPFPRADFYCYLDSRSAARNGNDPPSVRERGAWSVVPTRREPLEGLERRGARAEGETTHPALLTGSHSTRSQHLPGPRVAARGCRQDGCASSTMLLPPPPSPAPAP